MNFRAFSTRIAAVAALSVGSLSAQAATVGYFRTCSQYSGDISGVVAAAGRTVVPVTTLDSATLSGLDALVITVCPGGYVRDPDVDTAVSNGMGLVFERLTSGSPLQDSTQLPGAPTFGTAAVLAYPEADNVEVAAGAPILTGRGGTLTSTSLDRIGQSAYGYFNIVHWYPRASLPTGAIAFLTTGNPDHVGAFGYTHGRGRVVFTDSQWTLQLPGGYGANTESFAAGGAVFLANAIDWAAIPLFISCAAEGFTGTKFTLCRKVCEINQTPTALSGLIRIYRAAYREDPPCAN